MPRHNDEFNKERIVNEEGFGSFEYGNTQSEESTSYKDNSDRIRDEVNDNPSTNNENKSPEKEERRREEQKDGADKSSKSSSKSSSGGSSSAGGAGGITAAGAAVAAAASIIVGVVSIGAVPVSPEVSNVKFTPHETSIDCVFDISKTNSNLKFKVELYNEEINDYFEKDCEEGHNELEFADLHSSTEYTFEIFKGILNDQSQEYDYESIYSEAVSTLEPSGPVTVSFNSNGRRGTMSQFELDANSEYTLPVCIFVPFDDEYFGGWKVNGGEEKLQPGQTIVVKSDTSLVAAWDKFPTKENTVTANRMFFSYFPSQSSSEITTVSLMGVEFQCQYVYFNSNIETLNFDVEGGFVSTTKPFGGPISKITINTSSDQTADVDFTMVYSTSPIDHKTTESGETHTIAPNSTYTFTCTNPDARYFCLSNEGSVEPYISSMEFVYNTPVIENEFEVYFDANGGTGSFGPYTLSNTNKQELPDIETIGFVAPEGYKFFGWKVKGVEDILAPGTLVGISCDITLIAQWIEKERYTITFDSNGGSSVDSQSVEEDGNVVRPDDPTKYAYIFVDWYIDEELTTPYNFDEPVTGDLLLIAGWKPDADFSMYINYVDTLSQTPTYNLSYKYTKKDDYSLFTTFSLEIVGNQTITLEIGSLADGEDTAQTVTLDSADATALGTGIVDYTMKGTTINGETYDLATGSLSMTRSQKDYWLFAYIGGRQLETDSTGLTFPVMYIGTEGPDDYSSSSYYIPLRLDYADYNNSTHGNSDWRLVYSVDGTTETNASIDQVSTGYFNISISPSLFDPNTQRAELAYIYFKDKQGNQIGNRYENITLEASDRKTVAGFSLNTTKLMNPSTSPTFRISACGERGANPDNLYENYSFKTLGVDQSDFEASMSVKLLSKNGTIVKSYNINLVPYLNNYLTSSMSITNVTFEFIDTESGQDEREEFIELAKRYVVDVKLTVVTGGLTYISTCYESYSFR